MDPSLLEERETFKKKALSNPLVKTKRRDISEPESEKSEAASIPKPPKDIISKTCGASCPYDLQIFSKIIQYMRERHLEGQNYALSLEEILDETNQFFVSQRQKKWLVNEALANSPKLQVDADGKYFFQPTYDIKNRKAVLKLLEEHDKQGFGGILFDDIQESLPNAERILKGDNVIQITQPKSKKKVLFYNDKDLQFNVDEKFQNLWKSVPMDGLDDDKIENYLEKQGIKTFKNASIKKVTPIPKRKIPTKRKRSFKRLNEHMSGILEDYSDKA